VPILYYFIFSYFKGTFASPASSYTLWPDLVCLCFVRYLRVCSRGAVTYCPFLEEDLMIKKLFSGGQPGADRAGLMAARKMGIQTGGWVSARNFETDPWLWYHFGKFGMKVDERSSGSSEKNITVAKGTIRVATDFGTRAERKSLKLLLKHEKPFYDLNPATDSSKVYVEAVADWILRHEIRILNVSGNSERVCEGISGWTNRFLGRLFRRLGL
jgi:hypothetical protein